MNDVTRTAAGEGDPSPAKPASPTPQPAAPPTAPDELAPDDLDSVAGGVQPWWDGGNGATGAPPNSTW